jgi:hypothetical protein
MFTLSESHRYYLFAGGCDMRKGFDSLSGVVRSQMGRDPLSGEVFVFINRGRTTIKLLHWERGGLVIYHKRLEQGRFAMPRYDVLSGSYSLMWAELVMMVQGIQMSDVRYKKRYEKRYEKR